MVTKVFGVGLNKTGTTSLGKALEILGFTKHHSCDLELTRHWYNNNLNPIFEVADQNNSFEDWPWPLLYKEFYEKYPDSKFILTKRDNPEVWYDSLCRHALKKGPTEFRKKIYGFYMPHDFEKEHIHFYNNHNKEVEHFFAENAPDKLLILNLKDGHNWEKICSFLNVEIPDTEFPFLNNNSKKKTKKESTSVTISNKHAVKLVNTIKKMKS